MQSLKTKKLLEFNISKTILSSEKYFLIENDNKKKGFSDGRSIGKIYFSLNSEFKLIPKSNLKFKLKFKKFKDVQSLTSVCKNLNKGNYPAIVNVNFLVIKNSQILNIYILIWSLIFITFKNLIFNKLIFNNNFNT